jgi:MYXO-CTERM domain-containing protein
MRAALPLAGALLAGLLLAHPALAQKRPSRASPAAQASPHASPQKNPLEEQALALLGDAEVLEKRGKLDEAIQLTERAVALREKVFGQSHTLVAATIRLVADRYEKKQAYGNAIPLRERALLIIEKESGPDSVQVMYAVEEIGRTYLKAGDATRALKNFERALKMAEKRRTRPTDTTNVPRMIHEIADALTAKGEFAKAEEHYLETLRLWDLGGEGKKPMVAFALTDLGALYRKQKNYPKAIEVLERALKILADFWGTPNSQVLSAMSDLAGTYVTVGDLGRAEPLYARIVAIHEKSDDESVSFGTALFNLALVLDEKGDISRAEPLYRRSQEIREKHFPPGHIEIARSKLGLGRLLLTKGALSDARPLLLEAFDVWEKTHGAESREVAGPLAVIGELHRKTGALALAETLVTRALAINEKARGADDPSTADSRMSLGRIVETRGDPARAEQLYQRALAAREKTFGKDHPAVADSLFKLAELQRRKGDHASADRGYARAIAVLEASVGPEHVRVAEAREGLAALHLATGKRDQAIAEQARVSDLYEHTVWLVLATGSEGQKREFLSTLLASTDFTVNLHQSSAPAKNPVAERLALTTILQRKGRLLDVMADTLAAIRSRMSEGDRKLLDNLATARGRLALAVLRGPGLLSVSEHRAALTRMEEEVRKRESELGSKSQLVTARETPVTIERVQAAMPEDAVLVEYFVYRPRLSADEASESKWGPPRYAAYTLNAAGKTGSVDLGEVRDIDPLVQQLRRALASPDSSNFKQVGRALDEKILRPVRGLLNATKSANANTKRVLLSPDGLLNIVPFGALVDENGRFVLNQIELTYLTSGRDLLRLQAQTKPKSGPLIVANPAFGRAPVGSGSRGTALGKNVFGQLPGTAFEGKDLKKILGSDQAELLVDRQATEERLKGVQAPKILHIATHGFFLSDRVSAGASGARGLTLDAAPSAGSSPPPAPPPATAPQPQAAGPRVPVENPLLRSGLALAGANDPGSDKEDGILTALEAASLDLHGTKLVVLSACETGLGDVQNGDGVYGMRRALVMAGAETQVASLWKVADEETRDLMVSYYEKLQKGGGRSEAMREVQLAMMGKPATAHPYFWASFLVSGEPSPIDSAADDSNNNTTKKPSAGAALSPAKVAPGARGCACRAEPSESPAALGEGALVALALGAALARARRRRA